MHEREQVISSVDLEYLKKVNILGAVHISSKRNKIHHGFTWKKCDTLRNF